jgi:hypothetical protein
VNLKQLIKHITKHVIYWINDKKTGKLIFEINLSQGGIGDCRVRTEGRLKDED